MRMIRPTPHESMLQARDFFLEGIMIGVGKATSSRGESARVA